MREFNFNHWRQNAEHSVACRENPVIWLITKLPRRRNAPREQWIQQQKRTAPDWPGNKMDGRTQYTGTHSRPDCLTCGEGRRITPFRAVVRVYRNNRYRKTCRKAVEAFHWLVWEEQNPEIEHRTKTIIEFNNNLFVPRKGCHSAGVPTSQEGRGRPHVIDELYWSRARSIKAYCFDFVECASLIHKDYLEFSPRPTKQVQKCQAILYYGALCSRLGWLYNPMHDIRLTSSFASMLYLMIRAFSTYSTISRWYASAWCYLTRRREFSRLERAVQSDIYFVSKLWKKRKQKRTERTSTKIEKCKTTIGKKMPKKDNIEKTEMEREYTEIGQFNDDVEMKYWDDVRVMTNSWLLDEKLWCTKNMETAQKTTVLRPSMGANCTTTVPPL